jgi:hypothetical protein
VYVDGPRRTSDERIVAPKVAGSSPVGHPLVCSKTQQWLLALGACGSSMAAVDRGLLSNFPRGLHLYSPRGLYRWQRSGPTKDTKRHEYVFDHSCTQSSCGTDRLSSGVKCSMSLVLPCPISSPIPDHARANNRFGGKLTKQSQKVGGY